MALANHDTRTLQVTPEADDNAVVLRGAWEKHPKFGHQFKVVSFAFDQQLDPAGLAQFGKKLAAAWRARGRAAAKSLHDAG